MSLPKSLKYAVVQAGTNNLDQDNPKDIANGIITSALALTKKSKNLKVVVTGLLPRGLEWNWKRSKIQEVNKYLNIKCKKMKNITYMKQVNWTTRNGKLI